MRRAMVIGMVVAAVAWAAPGHAQSGGDRLPSAPFGYAVFGLGNVTLPSLQEGEGMRKERLRTGAFGKLSPKRAFIAHNPASRPQPKWSRGC
jgi:hypothetical protein